MTGQIPRLLGISQTNILLLDVKTHAVAKQQKICDIDDWLSPNNKSHDSLMLEFRATKPWTLVMSSLESLKSVTAAIWEALDMDGRFLNNGALRRDSFEFGESLLFCCCCLFCSACECSLLRMCFSCYRGHSRSPFIPENDCLPQTQSLTNKIERRHVYVSHTMLNINLFSRSFLNR